MKGLVLIALVHVALMAGSTQGVYREQYVALSGDSRVGNFNVIQDSTLFYSGAAPDESLCWGYNVAPGTGPELIGETVLAQCIEGHYQPYANTSYTEYQLRYVTLGGLYRRPVEIRINKQSGEIIQAYSASGLWLRTADDSENYQTFAPGMMAFRPTGGNTASTQFVNDDAAFQVQGGPTNRPLLLNAGWSYAALPGALTSNAYSQFSGNVYIGGSIYLTDQATQQQYRLTVINGQLDLQAVR